MTIESIYGSQSARSLEERALPPWQRAALDKLRSDTEWNAATNPAIMEVMARLESKLDKLLAASNVDPAHRDG